MRQQLLGKLAETRCYLKRIALSENLVGDGEE